MTKLQTIFFYDLPRARVKQELLPLFVVALNMVIELWCMLTPNILNANSEAFDLNWFTRTHARISFVSLHELADDIFDSSAISLGL